MKQKIIIILFLMNWVSIVYAQNNVPSISWVRGDTIESLRTKNPNVRFNLTSSLGNVHQFEVNEVENPIISTKTIFTFDDRGRLSSVILNKQGTNIDVYESLIRRYRTIYGNPVENNELTVRPDLTGATANANFENNLGSVHIIFAVSMVNNNPPYIMIIESFKYNNASVSNGSTRQRNEGSLTLINSNRSINYGNLVNYIPQLGQKGELTSDYSIVYNDRRYENRELGKVVYRINNEGNIKRIEFLLYFTSENELYEAVNNYANAFGLNNVRVRLNHSNMFSRNDWTSDMKIKDNIFHSISIKNMSNNRYLLDNSITILTNEWQEHYNQFRPIFDQRDFE